MSGDYLKSVSKSIDIELLFIGFFTSVLGFGNAVNAAWGTSSAVRGFAEMLFGISFLLLGNGLINFSKSS